MPLSHVLTNLDDARDTLVNSINSRGGNLEESATLYQCAAAVNALASGVLSINGHLPDESGSVTIPDATQTTSGLMSAADKAKLDNVDATYLPLSGGTITGEIKRNGIGMANRSAAGFLSFDGGEGGSSAGGMLLLADKAHADFPGCFLLRAADGQTQANLIGYPNGDLLWKNKSIFPAESLGPTGYFQLPGGTIVQYGQVTVTSGNSVTVTLPIAYTKKVSSILACCGQADTPVACSNRGTFTSITLTLPKELPGEMIFWLTMGY